MDNAKELILREKLLQQRAEIADELRRHGGPVENGAMSGLRDVEERAASLSDLWVDDRIATADGNLLAKIDLALRRLDEGKHEMCASCGGKIPTARLMAKPSASLCVSCQEKKDR